MLKLHTEKNKANNIITDRRNPAAKITAHEACLNQFNFRTIFDVSNRAIVGIRKKCGAVYQ